MKGTVWPDIGMHVCWEQCDTMLEQKVAHFYQSWPKNNHSSFSLKNYVFQLPQILRNFGCQELSKIAKSGHTVRDRNGVILIAKLFGDDSDFF